ncbi:MAG: hypothetical protein OEL91_06550, partial [Burkholderiaceae bacterium]|nr:hypothetical protein [Burkholderiaceae bacterium]
RLGALELPCQVVGQVALHPGQPAQAIQPPNPHIQARSPPHSRGPSTMDGAAGPPKRTTLALRRVRAVLAGLPVAVGRHDCGNHLATRRHAHPFTTPRSRNIVR